MADYYQVGEIVNTHGIKGEVRIQSVTSHPEERYAKGSQLLWVNAKQNKEEWLTVSSHRLHKSFHLLTFEGITNINDVMAYVGGTLNVTDDQLLDLEDDEFYHHDIIGLTVVDEDRQVIGELVEIIETGANDVWVVKRQGQKDLLLPFIDEVVKLIDFETDEIVVHVLEGLDD